MNRVLCFTIRRLNKQKLGTSLQLRTNKQRTIRRISEIVLCKKESVIEYLAIYGLLFCTLQRSMHAFCTQIWSSERPANYNNCLCAEIPLRHYEVCFFMHAQYKTIQQMHNEEIMSVCSSLYPHDVIISQRLCLILKFNSRRFVGHITSSLSAQYKLHFSRSSDQT